MSWFYVKQVRFPMRWLIRPALFLSLGLHALLFLLPLLPDRPVESDERDESAETEVSLTPLPIEPASPQPSTAIATPTPVPAPVPTSAPSPVPTPVNPPINPPVNSAPVPAPVPQPAVVVEPPPPTQSRSEPMETPPASPTSPPPQNQIVAPFANFPHLADASDCADQATEGCRQVSGNFRQVSQGLREQLRQQGYTVTSRDDLEETGRQVYEVTKDETTRYLSIVSSDLAGTAYVLAAEPVTQADIEQVGTVQAELETQLSQLSNGSIATAAQIAYPENFFIASQPRAEIRNLHWVRDTPPPQLVDRLTHDLQASGFQLSPVGEYGGGSLYEVSRQAFLGYLNLVPTSDGSGTIVVQWRQLPES